MAVGDGGSIAGSLLGGAADAEVMAAARRLTPARPNELVDVPIGDPKAVAAGLACGGVARLLVQDVTQLPAGLWTSMLARRPVALATLLAGPGGEGGNPAAPAALVIEDEPGSGNSERRAGEVSFGSAGLRAAALEEARKMLRTGKDASRVVEHEEGTIFVEAFVPPSRIVIVAEPSALAGAIVAQGSLLGWEPQVLSDLPAVLASIADLRSRDAVVVLSHDPGLDTPALDAAVRGSVYVGALGSRHTQGARRERLTALGVDEERLGRIHGPVGLDLGSRTPEETALSIFAEILAWRSGRGATSLSEGEGPING